MSPVSHSSSPTEVLAQTYLGQAGQASSKLIFIELLPKSDARALVRAYILGATGVLLVLEARKSCSFWGNGQVEVCHGTSGQEPGGYNFPWKSESLRWVSGSPLSTCDLLINLLLC